MPHAEENMPSAMVNGDQAPTRTLSHLKSYPVISDGIEGFKSNPYGAKSLELAAQANDALLAPVMPYTRRPYSYVQPYVVKADEICDDGLSKADKRWPVMKDDFSTITSKAHATAHSAASAPYNAVVATKDYLFTTFYREYKRCGQDGLVAGGKASVTSSIAIFSDVLNWVSEFVAGKTKEGERKIQEKTQ